MIACSLLLIRLSVGCFRSLPSCKCPFGLDCHEIVPLRVLRTYSNDGDMQATERCSQLATWSVPPSFGAAALAGGTFAFAAAGGAFFAPAEFLQHDGAIFALEHGAAW
jgi:hypothetical protein